MTDRLPGTTPPNSDGIDHTKDRRQDVRNVAIVAHVDHGKTTLVDALLGASGSLAAREAIPDCVLDSNDQERERGITILAKVCAIDWKGIRVNIIDTPGHADFGGEVERVVRMADGCLLLVDAFEGVMPQTRFVLRRALENRLRPILVVNKIDKSGAIPHEIADQVFDLMVELGAEDWQLDFPVLFGSGRHRYMRHKPEDTGMTMMPLLDAILEHIPGPLVGNTGLRLQTSNLDHSDFVGRIAVGRIYAGTITTGQSVSVARKADEAAKPGRVLKLHRPRGLGREEIQKAVAGDIVYVTGLEGIEISDTICPLDDPEALPPIPVDEPTIRMSFQVSASPLSGREGKPLQSRDLWGRLEREVERNVALRISATDRTEAFDVRGRGLLHLSVLIETMRREGFEFEVGPPRVIYRHENGKRMEPIELASVDVPESKASTVMGIMLERRAEFTGMTQRGSLQHLEFTIPSRGVIGLRTVLMTATQGDATLYTVVQGYGPYRGDISRRRNGGLISMCDGNAIAFAIFNIQDRGRLFTAVGQPVYEGLIVGECARENDLIVNLTKEKRLTNVRSAGAEEAVRIVPPIQLSLEEALEYIDDDELVEITPKSIRLRKAVRDGTERKRASRDTP